jgi:hypothetical protein
LDARLAKAPGPHVWYYLDSNPVMSRLGRVALNRILADC